VLTAVAEDIRFNAASDGEPPGDSRENGVSQKAAGAARHPTSLVSALDVFGSDGVEVAECRMDHECYPHWNLTRQDGTGSAYA